jgi:hypothetical protein
MNIVQQRSRTEGTGSSMGEMNMGGGPPSHAHVSVTMLHNMEIVCILEILLCSVNCC